MDNYPPPSAAIYQHEHTPQLPHYLATIMPATTLPGYQVFCTCGWTTHVTQLGHVQAAIRRHMAHNTTTNHTRSTP